jgi:Trk K+ transport system NAD-binding subunit
VKVIVLGAGGTGRELLRRLGSAWEVVLVDTDERRLQQAAAVRDFNAVAGDGSSAVVLARAGLGEAAALVAATPDDDANLEAIRIAKEAGLMRVVGVSGDPDRIEDYRELEVPVFSPNRLAARNVELALEPRRVASSAFAGGKAEAIEFHISPDASVAGRRLRDLHSQTWVVAAVLRGEELIVPHGDTTLEVGDRVTVVGAASDYAAIVATFTSGVSTFPLGFGRKVVVGVESENDVDLLVAEAAGLIRNSRADVLTVVLADSRDGVGSDDGRTGTRFEEAVTEVADGIDVEFRPAGGPLEEGLVRIARDESVGVIVVPGTDPGARYGRFKIAALLNTYLGAVRVPLLLARSPDSYREVLVPARRTASGDAAARAAVDLARNTGAPLSGIAAVAPAFVATRTDTLEEAQLAMAWLREEAAVHGVTVNRKVRQGNPVRVIAGLASAASLLVMGAPEPPIRGLSLGISGLVAARVEASVLLVPTGT